jgi:ParB-like chromosome segregation protein Spo0J
MTKEAFKGLAADIKANGLNNPIVTFEGKTLDGIHREKACVETGVRLRYDAFQGDANAALDYVISANLHRRHLTKSQCAMAAAKLANMKHGGDRKTPDQGAKLRKITRKSAATSLDVSERSVDDASAVHKHGTPELAEAVESGAVPVSVAADLTHTPKEEQRKAVENVKRECDDKGRPSPTAKKRLKAAAAAAKASSSRKGKVVPKLKGSGPPKDTGPSAEAFKAAAYGFAADIARHVTQSKWLTLIEPEKLPPKRREEVIRYLRAFIANAQALHDKLEGYGHDSSQEQSTPLHTAAA